MADFSLDALIEKVKCIEEKMNDDLENRERALSLAADNLKLRLTGEFATKLQLVELTAKTIVDLENKYEKIEAKMRAVLVALIAAGLAFGANIVAGLIYWFSTLKGN